VNYPISFVLKHSDGDVAHVIIIVHDENGRMVPVTLESFEQFQKMLLSQWAPAKGKK
jgi:hypothetical protein